MAPEEDLRGIRRMPWYHAYEQDKIVLLKVSDP